jgi:hypothetical protein
MPALATTMPIARSTYVDSDTTPLQDRHAPQIGDNDACAILCEPDAAAATVALRGSSDECCVANQHFDMKPSAPERMNQKYSRSGTPSDG